MHHPRQDGLCYTSHGALAGTRMNEYSNDTPALIIYGKGSLIYIEKGNMLQSLHGLLFLTDSKGSFICTIL